MKRTENQTEQWIRSNGLNVKTFNSTDVRVLKAQQVANTLLKQHSDLLSKSQKITLTGFVDATSTKRKVESITKGTCFKIMNIGTKINRQLFSQHRHIESGKN